MQKIEFQKNSDNNQKQNETQKSFLRKSLK